MTKKSASEERIKVLIVEDEESFIDALTVGLEREGFEVTYCLCTNGDAGGFDPEVPRSAIAGIRQEEQRAAAKEVGAGEVVFLGYPDGAVEYSVDLRRDIAVAIRRLRPDVVITANFDLTWGGVAINHADHRAVGLATLDAIRDAAKH